MTGQCDVTWTSVGSHFEVMCPLCFIFCCISHLKCLNMVFIDAAQCRKQITLVCGNTEFGRFIEFKQVLQSVHSCRPVLMFVSLISLFFLYIPYSLHGSYHNLNPIALRKAKIVYIFGLSESNRVKLKMFSQTNTGFLMFSLG